MEKKSEKDKTVDWLKEVPIQTESEAYTSEEMIACKKCKRNNPPTRLDCLYCGCDLEFDENQSQMLKPILRKAESYLNAFNLIYLGNCESWNEVQLTEIAKMTRVPKAGLSEIVMSKKALPLARTEFEKETEIVSQRLKELGIDSSILRDDQFKMEKIPRRLRRIEFEPDKLLFILFNNDEIVEIKPDDIALIVVGAAFERKLESTEKYSKKGEIKVLETAEISSDEILIDVYPKDDLVGYRISPKGFDFSGLGDEKQMIGIENVKILVERLKRFAPNAAFNDDYLGVRDKLAHIWQAEESSDSKGLKRRSFGSFNKTSVITTNNLTQFTKYSRLQYLLLKA